MDNCARRSSLFGAMRIEHIPYGIGADVYRPLDKAERERSSTCLTTRRSFCSAQPRLDGMRVRGCNSFLQPSSESLHGWGIAHL